VAQKDFLLALPNNFKPIPGKMTTLKFVILICAVSFSCFAQTSDSLNFAYWTPKSWFSGDKKLLRDNIHNYKFTQDQMDQLVNDINTSTVLGIYYKYDPKVHQGLVPTMKFYIRQNHSDDFDGFFLSMKNGIENVKPLVTNFKYVDNPMTVLIGQRKAFYASSTYNLKVQTGEVASVRTRFIGIPLGKKYLYATFLDNEQEDCADLYKEVIDKIKIE
jgi:transposase